MRIPYLTPPGWDGRSCLHWCGVSFMTWVGAALFILWACGVLSVLVLDLRHRQREKRLQTVRDVMES